MVSHTYFSRYLVLSEKEEGKLNESETDAKGQLKERYRKGKKEMEQKGNGKAKDN